MRSSPCVRKRPLSMTSYSHCKRRKSTAAESVVELLVYLFLLLGWRQSLVGWRPSLVGWRPLLLDLLFVLCPKGSVIFESKDFTPLGSEESCGRDLNTITICSLLSEPLHLLQGFAQLRLQPHGSRIESMCMVCVGASLCFWTSNAFVHP